MTKGGGTKAGALRWFTLCLACLGLNGLMQAHATERWKVVIVGESAGDSMPGDHPAWQRVDQAIAEELIAGGFSIYDKSALGLTLPCASPPCDNRPVADYVRWAQSQRGGIDLMVIYSISAIQSPGPAITRWQVRVPGRMVDVETAEIIDLWRGGENELSDQPGGSDAAYLNDWLADRLANTGADVGAILAEKLAAYQREFVYEAQVTGFALAEFDLLESALRSSPGYQGDSLEVSDKRDMHREWLHSRATKTFVFRTPMGAWELDDLIGKALSDAGISAAVRYEGRVFGIERHGMPYLGRYVGGLLLVLASLGVLWLMYVYRQHQAALAQARSPREALAYLERLSGRGLPWLPGWRVRATSWNASVDKVNTLLVRVQRHLDERAFDEATAALAEAEALEPGHPQIAVLAELLPRRRRAAELVAAAKARQDTDPAFAAEALTEAMALSPNDQDTLKPLLQSLQDRLRRGAVQQATQRAQAAMDSGHGYAALHAAGQGMEAIRGLDGMAAELASLRQLADQARRMITPLTGSARGTGLMERLRIAIDDQVGIGRGSVGDPGAIGVGYKRASRIGKQTRLLRDRSGLQLEDAGSTNGTQCDGQLLSPNRPVRLHSRHEIALGGNRESGAAGACRLIVRLPPGAQNSAVIACDPAPLRMLDATQLAEVWPSQQEDLSTVWLALADPVPLALGEALLPAAEGEKADIALGYNNGYFLAPIEEGSESKVRIDGEPVTTRTPISASAQLSINGRSFGLVDWSP